MNKKDRPDTTPKPERRPLWSLALWSKIPSYSIRPPEIKLPEIFSSLGTSSRILKQRYAWYGDLEACAFITIPHAAGMEITEESAAAFERLVNQIPWSIKDAEVTEALNNISMEEGKEIATVKHEVLCKATVLALGAMGEPQRHREGRDGWVRDAQTGEIATFIPDELPLASFDLFWERLKDRAVSEAIAILVESGRSRKETEVLFEELTSYPDESPGPLDILLAQAEQDSVRPAMLHLQHDDRQALSLYADGYTGTQIATLLNITPAAVRKRIQRAKQRLRRIMETD